jgi:hypothetical protein
MRTSGLLFVAVLIFGGWTPQGGARIETKSRLSPAATRPASTLQVDWVECELYGQPYGLVCSGSFSGGTGPYIYGWSERLSGTISSPSQLPGANYPSYGSCGSYPYNTQVTLFVQDSNGAIASATDTQTGYCV